MPMMIRTTRSSMSVKPLSSRALMRCLRECMQFSFDGRGTQTRPLSAARAATRPPDRVIRVTNPHPQRGMPLLCGRRSPSIERLPAARLRAVRRAKKRGRGLPRPLAVLDSYPLRTGDVPDLIVGEHGAAGAVGLGGVAALRVRQAVGGGAGAADSQARGDALVDRLQRCEVHSDVGLV